MLERDRARWRNRCSPQPRAAWRLASAWGKADPAGKNSDDDKQKGRVETRPLVKIIWSGLRRDRGLGRDRRGGGSAKVWIEAELHLAALGVRLRLALQALRRSFISAKTTDLVHDALGIHLGLEPLQRAVDRLSFTNGYFWHGNLSE